jgi:hypothetical protein
MKLETLVMLLRLWTSEFPHSGRVEEVEKGLDDDNEDDDVVYHPNGSVDERLTSENRARRRLNKNKTGMEGNKI